MVQKPKDKDQKLSIYARLLNVDDPETLDTKALAEAVGISVQTLGGLMGQLKNNPKIREELTAAGFLDDQIPSWVAKPLDTSKEVPEQLAPASTPTTAKARKMAGSGSQPGVVVSSGSQQGSAGKGCGREGLEYDLHHDGG